MRKQSLKRNAEGLMQKAEGFKAKSSISDKRSL